MLFEKYNETKYYILIVVILLCEFLLLKDVPAFWDAKSKFLRAGWLYDNNYSQLVVSTDLNSGHPPLWILLIAMFWTIFGKFIWSARLLLLIVNLGVFYQILRLEKVTLEKTVPYLAIFLVFIEPTLVAQTTILNNDMLLLFFTLVALNSLLKNNWWWYTLGLSGLLFSNLRGIYCFIALAIIHFIMYRKSLVSFKKSFNTSYILPLVLFGMFLLYQYNHLGWIVITPNKSYADQRESVGIVSSLKNIIVYIKNFLDFGRLFLWMGLGLLTWRSLYVARNSWSHENRILLISLLSFCGVFFLGMVPFSNPIGARYFLICYILSILLFLNLIFQESLIGNNIRKLGIIATVIGFISGHFWIYPTKIAQSWDSSLAYLNYFPMEEKMISFIQEQGIDPADIGTNLSTGTYWVARASEPLNNFASFKDVDTSKNKYILFSNIENTSSDQLIDEIQSNWQLIKTFSQLGVFVSLYMNPEKPF